MADRDELKNKNNWIYLWIYLVAFCVSAIPALFLSAPQVEDPLGTMGAAAYLTGYDWGDFLVEKGFYYKYGQTVFYLPVYLCVNNPVIRYKVLLVVNSLVTALIPVIICVICDKHFEMARRDSVPISMLVGCMPSILLYSKLTWAEPVLSLMPWVVIYIVLELSEMVRSNRAGSDSGKGHGDVVFGEPENFRKQRVLFSAALAWCSVYAFMSHQRGIIIVLGTVLFIIVYAITQKARLVEPLVFVVNLVVALGLERLLDAWQKLYIYQGAELSHNLLSAFLHIEIYQKIFSPFGMRVLGKTIKGWLFNSASSGLGITLLGIIVCVLSVFGLRKKTHLYSDDLEAGKFRIVVGMGSIFYAGAFLLGVMFFFECLYDYYQGTDVVRCDHLVFGRYLESVLPVMMFIGLCWLRKQYDRANKMGDDKSDIIRKDSGVACLVLILMALLTGFFVMVIAPVMEGVDSYVHSLMPVNICFDMTGVTVTQDIIRNLPFALAVFGIFACLVYLVSIILARKGKFMAIYVILGSIFAYIYLRGFVDILYRVDVNSLTEYAKFYLMSSGR